MLNNLLQITNSFNSHKSNENEKKLNYNNQNMIKNQENLIENLNELNSNVEAKSSEILSNLEIIQKNIGKEDYNYSIENINKVFKNIDSEKIINSLKSIKTNLAQIILSNDEMKSSAKNMTDNLEALILNLKKAEENDLFLLINLVS